MKKQSLFLLIAGLVLSQFIVIRFNLNDGFEFHNFWIKLLPIAEYAGESSEESYLTSTLLGYLAFIIFGVTHTSKQKFPEIFKSTLMFTGIAIVVTFFEFTSILEDLNGTYQGKHFRIGWLLFLVGFWIFGKEYSIKKSIILFGRQNKK
ncbi:MAG: hypothetical protein V2I54_06105 [Bacteroidales bacterium]|nr:hypothetical protein [Bacteroidales bacterium]